MITTSCGIVRRAYSDIAAVDRIFAINTTPYHRIYLFRKWRAALKRANIAGPSFPASTMAGDYVTKGIDGETELTWDPSTFSTSQSVSSTTAPVNKEGKNEKNPSLKDTSTSNVGRSNLVLGSKRVGIEIGRRFFARISASLLNENILRQEQNFVHTEWWRQSRSEDTHDMDEQMVQLLMLDAERLPKPCDPMTYCFWKHGMHRYFEPVATNFTPPNPNALTFTVCSYNVLCQRTLSYYLEKLYSHCPYEYLSWNRRWPVLAVELQMLNSDIFCLQEVQYDHFDQYYSPLFSKLGYDGTFKRKLRKKSDGCATFWRRDKFKPLHILPVEYSFPAPHAHSDSVALITVFEPIRKTDGTSGSPLVVANTHLIYQPALGGTKLCQSASLLAHLQNVTQQYGMSSESGRPAHLIVCGDFNSTPYSPLYSLFVEGRLRYQGLTGWAISGQKQLQNQANDKVPNRLESIGDTVLGSALLPSGEECSGKEGGILAHSLNLRSVYDHTTKNGEREVSTFLRDQPMSVDYIFYSVRDKTIIKRSQSEGNLGKANGYQTPWRLTNVREGGLRCLERYRLPGLSELNRTIGYLPNQYCASDHLPLMSKFALE